jgi:hypothetical protein
MPAQNNTGRQFDKTHGVTIVAQVAIADARFVAFDGGYPTNAGGAKAVQGVAESNAAAGDALNLVTDYSALVETAGAIAFGTLVQSDATGRATPGTLVSHCGRALGAATAAGQLIEVQLLQHTHA